MNKYVVKMTHMFSSIVEVEAENKELALDEGERAFSEAGDNNTKLYYEGTMDKNSWAVLTIEEYENLKSQVKESFENSKEESSNIIIP